MEEAQENALGSSGVHVFCGRRLWLQRRAQFHGTDTRQNMKWPNSSGYIYIYIDIDRYVYIYIYIELRFIRMTYVVSSPRLRDSHFNRSRKIWLLSDLSTRQCSFCLMAASLSLQTSLAVAISTGLCGYFWRPVAIAPACVCRCDIPDPDGARLGFRPSDSSSNLDREPRHTYAFDTSVSLVLGAFLGFVLAVVLKKLWNGLLENLRNALHQPPPLRRHRALAP